MNLNYSLAVLLVFVVSNQSTAAELSSTAECKHTIVVLPQTHQNNLRNRGFDEGVAVSQYFIGSYIQAHPGVPVFAEGNSDDLDEDEFKRLFPGNGAETIKAARALFPDGMPDEYGKLSSTQKEKMAAHGVWLILLLSGRLDKAYSTIADGANYERVFAEVKAYLAVHPNDDALAVPNFCHWEFDEQERDALNHINTFFAAHPNTKEVFLVYGAIHDFSRYPDLFPSQCVRRMDNFDFEHTQKMACH